MSLRHASAKARTRAPMPSISDFRLRYARSRYARRSIRAIHVHVRGPVLVISSSVLRRRKRSIRSAFTPGPAASERDLAQYKRGDKYPILFYYDCKRRTENCVSRRRTCVSEARILALFAQRALISVVASAVVITLNYEVPYQTERRSGFLDLRLPLPRRKIHAVILFASVSYRPVRIANILCIHKRISSRKALRELYRLYQATWKCS